MVRRLLLRLRALDDLEGFLRGRAFVDDRPDAADHADGIRRLPDVAGHVDALCAGLYRVVRQLERVGVRLQRRSSRDGERDRARLRDRREILAGIGSAGCGTARGGSSVLRAMSGLYVGRMRSPWSAATMTV